MVTTNDQGPFGGAHDPQTSVAPEPAATPRDGWGSPIPTGPKHAQEGGRPQGGARRLVVPIVVGVVVALLAAGVTIAVLRPGAEDARDQRDQAQAELASARSDLADANGRATAASATARGCQQLSDDSAQLVTALAQMEDLTEAYWNAPAGSPEEADLARQLDDNYRQLIRLRGAIASDQSICSGTPVGT